MQYNIKDIYKTEKKEEKEKKIITIIKKQIRKNLQIT